MATTAPPLTIEELMKYKPLNPDMPPQLCDFACQLNHNPARNRRRYNNKAKPKWLSREEQDDDQKLFSAITGLLNKINESNFDELIQDLINMEITTRDHMVNLVDVILRKSIGESKFSDTYALLCKKMANYYIDDNDDRVHFREILVTRCQRMFEEAVSLDKALEEDLSFDSDSIFQHKEQIMGCITFIGMLYNRGLLVSRIIDSCFTMLIMNTDLNKAYTIESITTLMRTVGEKLHKEAKNEADNIYVKIEALANDRRLKMKDKFALMDLVDLRDTKHWY